MCEKPRLMSDFYGNLPIPLDLALEYEKLSLTTHSFLTLRIYVWKNLKVSNCKVL